MLTYSVVELLSLPLSSTFATTGRCVHIDTIGSVVRANNEKLLEEPVPMKTTTEDGDEIVYYTGKSYMDVNQGQVTLYAELYTRPEGKEGITSLTSTSSFRDSDGGSCTSEL